MSISESNAGIYYVHGGVAQGLNLSKRYLREMAKHTGAVVFATDYRRPPNSPFPDAFDDCLTGNLLSINVPETLYFRYKLHCKACG